MLGIQLSALRRSLSNYQRYYRWGIEPSFRDTKDLRFGMGLSTVHISDPQRRDRLLLLNAFAVLLLTLLGAAGESLGMDRHLKSNTVKTRSHSLFRQGCMLYDLTPNMPEHRLPPLVDRYAELLQQSRVFYRLSRSHEMRGCLRPASVLHGYNQSKSITYDKNYSHLGQNPVNSFTFHLNKTATQSHSQANVLFWLNFVCDNLVNPCNMPT